MPNQEIKMSDIFCSADREQGDLQSLIQSIEATNGTLLQPILLRKIKSSYLVYDGRRRFAALKAMGRETLKANEYILAGDEVNPKTVSYIANTERKALSPLEEARQICDMLKTMEAEEIAEKLGKTLHYVVSRSRLADLSGEWQKVLAEPENYPQWTIGKLQMVAREPAATQKEIAHLINGNYKLSHLWERISYYHRKLTDAPFKWQNVCRVCDRRSDRQGVLFEEDAAEATCLDSECYEKQCFISFKKQLKTNPALKPVRSSGANYDSEAYKWAQKNKVPETWQVSYKLVEDPAKADGIICCGENTGRLVKITKAPAAKTSADAAADRKAENAKKAEIKEKREILRIAMQKFVDQLKRITKWSVLPDCLHEKLWQLMYHVGLSGARFWHFAAGDIKPPENDLSWQDRLLAKLIHDIVDFTEGCIVNPQLDVERKFEKEICKILEWNWELNFLIPAQKEYEQTKGRKK